MKWTIYTQSIVIRIIILQFFIDVLFGLFIISRVSRSCRPCRFFYILWNLTLSVFWYHTASCWFFQLLWVGRSLIYIVFIHLWIIWVALVIFLFDVKLTIKLFLVLMLFNYIHKNILKRTISDCNIHNLQLFLNLLNFLKYFWNFEFRKNFKDQISIIPF